MTPLWLLAALAMTAAAYFASEVLIPLAIALLLSVLLDPLVCWCEARGVRRGRGAALVVGGFLLTAGASVWGCSQPFSRIAADMPRYMEKFRAVASAFDRRARRFEESTEMVHKAFRPPAPSSEPAESDGVASWSQFFWRGLGSFFEAAGIAMFVPFLMIGLLSEKDLLAGGFERLVGAAFDAGWIERQTGPMVRAYFYGNLMAGAGMALCHWLFFAALGLRNAAGLGLVTGLLTLIPIIGLPVALLLPTAQGLLQFEGILPFVLLAMGMAALHLVTANHVVPRVIGGRVNLNATAATAGLLFWGWLWGITGFVLAVPLTALLKIVLESGRGTGAYAGLLAGHPRALRPWFGRRWLTEVKDASRHLARSARDRAA